MLRRRSFFEPLARFVFAAKISHFHTPRPPSNKTNIGAFPLVKSRDYGKSRAEKHIKQTSGAFACLTCCTLGVLDVKNVELC